MNPMKCGLRFFLVAMWIVMSSVAADAEDDLAAITTLFDRLTAAFSAGQAEILAGEIFAENGIRVLNDRVAPLTGKAETQAFFESYIGGLRAEGYDHSIIVGRSICLMSAHEAMATINFERYDQQGRVIPPGKRATSFVLHKSAAGWRVATAFGHDPAKAIACKE